MDTTALRAKLVDAGLAQYADALVAAARPGIRLVVDPNLDHEVVGASRLGGDPDLPPRAEWPRKDGAPLSFIGQLDLAEVARHDDEGLLPRDGLLSFFYDATTQEAWGFDPADRGSWDVRHLPAGQQLQRTAAPDDLAADGRLTGVGVRPRAELCPVPYESLVVERLGMSVEELDAYGDLLDLLEVGYQATHRALGHPDPVQGEMQLECQLASNGVFVGGPEGYRDPRVLDLGPGADDWRLLLQVDSDDATDMMWGDAGRIYFWIRDQDLRVGAFDRSWVILQCS